MTHVVQPVSDERTFQRSVVLFLRTQAFQQVLTRFAYPTWNLDKCQHFLLQVLIACQTVQCFQVNVDTLVLEFVTTTSTDNQCIITQSSTEQLVRQVQESSTSFLTLWSKSTSLRNKVVFKTVHQDNVCRLIQQFLTFVIGNFAYCSETVYVVCSLLFNRVLGFHIQFTSHLVTVVSKKIIVKRLVISCD